MHDAGNVAAEDGGPLLDEDTDILHVGVERVDGDGGVLDDNLAGTSGGQRGVTDFEGSTGLGEPGSLVGDGHCG